MNQAEELDHVRILKGPPIPSLLPTKGLGIFTEGDGIQYCALSKFSNSDTLIGIPISGWGAWRLFWHIFGSRWRPQ